MSYGSNEAVEDAEAQYREDRAVEIAGMAAKLVAAGDMGREDAVNKVAEWFRRDSEAQGDVTGTLEVENVLPLPSKEASPQQVAVIQSALMDLARDASDSI